MPTLILDNLSDSLYRQLESLAEAHQRPLQEEAVQLLQEALGRHHFTNGQRPSDSSQQEILDQIIRERYTPSSGTPDSVDLLREDRGR